MGKTVSIIFIGIVGFFLIQGFINTPPPSKGDAWIFLFWSAGATFMGIYATFFPKKLNALNAQRFEKFYKRTKFPLFKSMAQGTRGQTQEIVTPAVGIIFLIIGPAMFIQSVLVILGS